MSRVAITEYAAKKLCLGDVYEGVTVTKETLKQGGLSLSKNHKSYAVKVDVGIKKRGLQKLIALDISESEVSKTLQNFFKQGYERCLVEPYFKHQPADEKYLSLSLEREGLRIMHSSVAGVEIEKHKEKVKSFFVPHSEALKSNEELDGTSLNQILEVMQKYHFSFLEMNPYLISSGQLIPIDMAVEVDTAGYRQWPSWVAEHVVTKPVVTKEEAAIVDLNDTSQASFNLNNFNPDGSILTVLSGGGASLVALDTLVASNLKDEIINYCEYSGAPTREETQVFMETLLSILFKSKAKKKVVLIAGGVSNFTDVLKTFQGIVDAIKQNIDLVKKQKICFVVRRGGLNQAEGLMRLTNFFMENKIPHEVNGPDLSLGEVGSLIKKYL